MPLYVGCAMLPYAGVCMLVMKAGICWTSDVMMFLFVSSVKDSQCSLPPALSCYCV